VRVRPFSIFNLNHTICGRRAMSKTIQAIPAHVATMKNVPLFTKSIAQYSAWMFGLSERRIPFTVKFQLNGWRFVINPSK
jgi:hypothetical protein